MNALRLAIRSVTRRLGTLAFVLFPAMMLFAMLTFVSASEATIRRLTAPGIHQRAFRVGMVEGLSWETAGFSKADVAKMGSVPGAHMAPANFNRCAVDPTRPEDLNCGATVRAYVEIWDMNWHYTQAELDAWDKVPNGVLVPRAAAVKNGWKVGDHISVGFVVNPSNLPPLELVVVAIADKYIDPNMLFYHEKYYDDHYNKKSSYWVVWGLVDSPEVRAGVISAIESKLQEMNHPYTMWTMELTEQGILSCTKVLRESFRVAGLASFFVVVCVGVTLLIISIERRRQEFAALLAIGFPRVTLSVSILLEGIFLILPAAVLGGALMWVLFHNRAIEFDQIFQVWIHETDVVATCLVGLGVGLGAAIVPAVRVYRLDVLAALR